MKRFACFFLCCLLLLILAAPVRAEDEHEDLRQLILECISKGEGVDVSSYGLTQEQLQEIYGEMFYQGLLPWYLDTYVDWSSAPDGTVTRMIPRDMRTRGYDEKKYEQAMAELIAVTCHEGMTQEQMVLSVHDHIATMVQYSLMGTLNNGYQALVRGETACFGYAQLFMRVLERLDIPCRIVICEDTGNGLGHAWNAVCLNGNWYHVDVTWDDPAKDVDGRVDHDHFLKTDKEFASEENGHTFGWETDVECTDRTYAFNPFWEGITSPILFPGDGYMYYRQDDTANIYIYKQSLKTGAETLVYRQKQPPVLLEGKYYYCETRGLAVRNGRVWFNTAEAVCSVTTDGEDLRAEYACETMADGIIIRGFHIMDNSLLVTFIGPTNQLIKKQIALTDDPGHIHSYQARTVSATCDQGGYKEHSCTCGIVFYTNHTQKLGHDLVIEQGDNSEIWICQRCSYRENHPCPPKEEQTPSYGWVIAAVGLGVVCITLASVLYFCRKRKVHK
ncbi:MAG: hypothetical protein E7447_06160 [Ruminococcaceae bacterium]|nr:hypothetical protein [Oscillospiraceae bacterium]